MGGMNNRDNFDGHKNSARHQHIDHAAFNLVEHVFQGHGDVKQQVNFDYGIEQPE